SDIDRSTSEAFWVMEAGAVYGGAYDQEGLKEIAKSRLVELTSANTLRTGVLAFFADRLKVLLRDQGKRHDLVDAVFALGDDDLVRIVRRVEALDAFLASDDGANLLAGHRRASNILKAEAKKGELPTGMVQTGLPNQPEAEVALAFAVGDRKSTRLNSSHVKNSYAVICLKKKRQ